MTDITYDPEADAVYIAVARGKVDRTEEAGPFIYDVNAEGHIIGIEILSARKVLAPGDRKKARRRGIRTSAPPNSGASPSRSRLGLRDPHLLAEIRRQVALMSQHPATIDEWIEAVYDWSDWK